MQQRTKDCLWALGLTALMVIVGLLRLSTPLPLPLSWPESLG